MSVRELILRSLVTVRDLFKSLAHSFLATFGHKEYRPFIILSRSRTGSNLLISYLNFHPNIIAEREIFRFLDGRDYQDVLGRVFGKQPFFVKAKGFKLFYSHPIDDKDSKLWDTLAAMDNLSVIHLKRKNILRTLVSRKIAGMTDVWVAKSDDQLRKNVSISFTNEELIEGFQQTRDWEVYGDSHFENQHLRSFYYEDLARHTEGTFREITEFLGVRYRKPRTKQIKQNKKSLAETIENYDALKEEFSGTEWQIYFDEEFP